MGNAKKFAINPLRFEINPINFDGFFCTHVEYRG